jgi:hypothetical protein
MNSHERRAASEQLGDAIPTMLEKHGPVDGILGDWVVVACTVAFDDEGDPSAQYHMGFSNGAMMEHTAIGLFEQGKHLLMHGKMQDGPAESA